MNSILKNNSNPSPAEQISIDDEYSLLDIALSEEWQANGFPRTQKELRELEEENS